jgi:hypothetical protein
MRQLEELDMSFNQIASEEGLMNCVEMANLRILIISGNPFAIRGMEYYEELEH